MKCYIQLSYGMHVNNYETGFENHFICNSGALISQHTTLEDPYNCLICIKVL